jgi:hypothetical protein
VTWSTGDGLGTRNGPADDRQRQRALDTGGRTLSIVTLIVMMRRALSVVTTSMLVVVVG